MDTSNIIVRPSGIFKARDEQDHLVVLIVGEHRTGVGFPGGKSTNRSTIGFFNDFYQKNQQTIDKILDNSPMGISLEEQRFLDFADSPLTRIALFSELYQELGVLPNPELMEAKGITDIKKNYLTTDEKKLIRNTEGKRNVPSYLTNIQIKSLYIDRHKGKIMFLPTYCVNYTQNKAAINQGINLQQQGRSEVTFYRWCEPGTLVGKDIHFHGKRHSINNSAIYFGEKINREEVGPPKDKIDIGLLISSITPLKETPFAIY